MRAKAFSLVVARHPSVMPNSPTVNHVVRSIARMNRYSDKPNKKSARLVFKGTVL
jgi:hypothetical protein